MGRMVVIFLVILLLGGTFAGAAYAGLNGFGLIASGAPFARAGSIGGPVVMGGGPGSGK